MGLGPAVVLLQLIVFVVVVVLAIVHAKAALRIAWLSLMLVTYFIAGVVFVYGHPEQGVSKSSLREAVVYFFEGKGLAVSLLHTCFGLICIAVLVWNRQQVRG